MQNTVEYPTEEQPHPMDTAVSFLVASKDGVVKMKGICAHQHHPPHRELVRQANESDGTGNVW